VTIHDEFFVLCTSHPAREGSRPWAGAQRPKAGCNDALPPAKPAGCVYTQKNRAPLGVKLRQQAIKNGLTPGSPRWRAYVLGTLQASKKRKAKKRKGGETGLVTPVR
jgi:hypothetical protein